MILGTRDDGFIDGCDGLYVGLTELGFNVGNVVGLRDVGLDEGLALGLVEIGLEVGDDTGLLDEGCEEGFAVGLFELGFHVGRAEGGREGAFVVSGNAVGMEEVLGPLVGPLLGWVVGPILGVGVMLCRISRSVALMLL